MKPSRVLGVTTSTAMIAGLMLAIGPVSPAAAGEQMFSAFDGDGNPILTAQPWTVPDGVTGIQVIANGGGGGCPTAAPVAASGGGGAHVEASVPVVPGQALQILIGQQGGAGDGPSSIGGGWPNGGSGGNVLKLGGGGDGSTEIRTGSNERLLVAGGGGGCSFFDGTTWANGGNAADNGTANGEDGDKAGIGLQGGGGANGATPGIGGAGSTSGSPGALPTVNGTGGAGAASGGGGTASGGGGGGYAGGGGGASAVIGTAAGGGAGSSFVASDQAEYTEMAGLAAAGTMNITWIDILTHNFEIGTVGKAYSEPLSANADQRGEIFGWTVVNGSLPPGLTILPSSRVQGTPTAAGTYNFTLQAARSGTGMTSQKSFTITIAGDAPTAATSAAGVSGTSATLNGVVTTGGAATNASFTYGTDPTLAGGATVPAGSVPAESPESH